MRRQVLSRAETFVFTIDQSRLSFLDHVALIIYDQLITLGAEMRLFWTVYQHSRILRGRRVREYAQ